MEKSEQFTQQPKESVLSEAKVLPAERLERSLSLKQQYLDAIVVLEGLKKLVAGRIIAKEDGLPSEWRPTLNSLIEKFLRIPLNQGAGEHSHEVIEMAFESMIKDGTIEETLERYREWAKAAENDATNLQHEIVKRAARTVKLGGSDGMTPPSAPGETE